jgi:O-antigen/teichoic acid export membrane protein
MALLALVLLVHQPIYLVTQFLIARARQHEIARVLVGASIANIVLSVVLASTVGIWGVALSTLLTDVGVLVYVVPVLVAPAASVSVATFAWATLKPVIPGAVAALIVLVGIARVAQPDTLLELLPLGVVWGLGCGWALWQFGLDPAERAGLGRQLRPPPAAAVPDLG